jgi:hypothetical protein
VVYGPHRVSLAAAAGLNSSSTGSAATKKFECAFLGGKKRNETKFWCGPRGEIQDDVTWRSGNEWKPSRASMNG